MRMVLALLMSAGAAAASAQDCVPKFFNSEPRDSEWFYGAGKGDDAAAARESALRHLSVKATGGEAALADGTLAGWEQDDHGECAGTHYALVRIEQARVRRNLAAESARPKDVKPEAPAPPQPVVVNARVDNNITVQAPPGEHHLVLLIIFLCFLVACLALVDRPRVVAFWRPPVGSGPTAAGAGVAPAPASTLREKFKAVPRQTQRDAIGEIARLGMPAYFRAHKGEGTCRPVPGTAELLQAGVTELMRPYTAGDWKLTWEDTSGIAVSVKDQLVMGFAFFLYASDAPGNVDCEIIYEITSSAIADSYRNQMEEGLHQGLPWAVQAAAGRMGAARSEGRAS